MIARNATSRADRSRSGRGGSASMSTFLRQLDATLEPPKNPPPPKQQDVGTPGFFARIRLDIIPTKPQLKPTTNATPSPPPSPSKESAPKGSSSPTKSAFPDPRKPPSPRRRSLERNCPSSATRHLHHRRAVALSREPTIDPIAELSPAELLLLEQDEGLEDEKNQQRGGTESPTAPGSLDKDLPEARCGATLEELLAQRKAALKAVMQARKSTRDPTSITGLEQGLSDLDSKIKAAREQLQNQSRWNRKNLFGRFLG